MIATCPHCQSGFYITPDMAGNVVTCSKCKKQVRAPDRRGRGADAPSDGIPYAILAETRAETEERLKTEIESRMAAENKLAEAEGAKAKAEELLKQQGEAISRFEKQLTEVTEAKAALVERLKTIGDAQSGDQKAALIEAEIAAREKAQEEARQAASKNAALEEELKAEKTARAQVEQQLRTAVQERQRAEEKLQLETRAHEQGQERLKAESQAKTDIEAKLKAEIEHRTKIEAELKAKGELDQRLEKEMHKQSQLESQLKAETSARLRSQAQLEQEVDRRAKLQQEISTLQVQISSGAPGQEVKVTERPIRLAGVRKGLLRMAIVLSPLGAVAGGLFAYSNGYIINSRFDRPMMLPFFDKPHLVPIDLILISIAGFVSVWVLYLLALFVVRGFAAQEPVQTAKHRKVERKQQVPSVIEETKQEPGFVPGMWRS